MCNNLAMTVNLLCCSLIKFKFYNEMSVKTFPQVIAVENEKVIHIRNIKEFLWEQFPINNKSSAKRMKKQFTETNMIIKPQAIQNKVTL